MSYFIILWTTYQGFCLRWMQQNTSDDKSILVHVMAWCSQATCHHLSQRWLRYMVPLGHSESMKQDIPVDTSGFNICRILCFPNLQNLAFLWSAYIEFRWKLYQNNLQCLIHSFTCPKPSGNGICRTLLTYVNWVIVLWLNPKGIWIHCITCISNK